MALAALSLNATACGDDDDDDDGEATGTLSFYANGEEFIRDGFVSKDGWAIAFDHFWVHLTDLAAYQVVEDSAKHAGHPHSDIPDGSAHAALSNAYWLDLTEGDDAQWVGEVEDAAIGNYNYLNFSFTQNDEGDYAGHSIVMIGSATKGEETVDFVIALEDEMAFVNCAQEVDDEAAGVVEDGGQGSVEVTFHSDHLFGDAEEPEDEVDGVNDIALGFDAFAALADEGALDTTGTPLSDLLGESEYQVWRSALHTVGHSGEGHCDYETYEPEDS